MPSQQRTLSVVSKWGDAHQAADGQVRGISFPSDLCFFPPWSQCLRNLEILVPLKGKLVSVAEKITGKRWARVSWEATPFHCQVLEARGKQGRSPAPRVRLAARPHGDVTGKGAAARRLSGTQTPKSSAGYEQIKPHLTQNDLHAASR